MINTNITSANCVKKLGTSNGAAPCTSASTVTSKVPAINPRTVLVKIVNIPCAFEEECPHHLKWRVFLVIKTDTFAKTATTTNAAIATAVLPIIFLKTALDAPLVLARDKPPDGIAFVNNELKNQQSR
jgi:hypothetical protein